MYSELAYHWQPCSGGVRLLRVYGDTPCPVLPAQLCGQEICEIGAYCFSASEPALPADAHFTAPDGGTPQQYPHAVSGDFLQQITLPDTVTTLHNTAFYNCRKLTRVIAGARLAALGSNVFTNCRALQMFTLRCPPDAETGLKKLLACTSEDVSAEFRPGALDAPAARLFYPDYLEFLDESAPAHLFILNIEGEGYRYRQCFDGGRLNFAQYDAAFAHATEGEAEPALCRIALDRLLLPYALQAADRAAYLAYLRLHPDAAAAAAVAMRDAAALKMLAAEALREPKTRRAAAAMCRAAGWSEGAALVLGGQSGKKQKKRYDFE